VFVTVRVYHFRSHYIERTNTIIIMMRITIVITLTV
jgi:hypothetical protein